MTHRPHAINRLPARDAAALLAQLSLNTGFT
jgi:hypothetical protein